MKPKDSISPYSGSQSSVGLCVVTAGIMTLVVIACACGHNSVERRPTWAQEYYPDYNTLVQPYELIAIELRTGTNGRTNSIKTFDELTAVVQKDNPETKAGLGENPFPGLLPPQHSYCWLSSWECINNSNDEIPVIWTTVQLREPAILYITSLGEVRAEKPEVFKGLLDHAIERGAKLGTTNE